MLILIAAPLGISRFVGEGSSSLLAGPLGFLEVPQHRFFHVLILIAAPLDISRFVGEGSSSLLAGPIVLPEVPRSGSLCIGPPR